MSAKKGRSYEKGFEVAAPVEAVWKAVTEGEELTRWFCMEATCDQGVGGKQHIDRGEAPMRPPPSRSGSRACISAPRPPARTSDRTQRPNAMRSTGTSSTRGHHARGHFLYRSLVTWGLPKADVDALGARLKAIVWGLFPQKSDAPLSAGTAESAAPPAAETG